MENQNTVALIAEMLCMEVEHLGDEAFSFAPLSDAEISSLTGEMGAVPVYELSPDEVTLINDDPDLREMYAAIQGTYTETLPDLDALQAQLDADAIKTVRAHTEVAA